jgi:hypothetical protein
MVIKRTKKEVIFRLSTGISVEELQEVADFLAFKEIVSKSKTRQSDVDTLVKKIKKGRWHKAKARLGL